MKRMLGVVVALFLAGVLLAVSVMAEAQGRLEPEASNEGPSLIKVGDKVGEAEAEAEATDSAEVELISKGEQEKEELEPVDYYLAYPGILPDHPLYFLKMIRDRLLLWLTRDPVERVERLLLYADKRIGAAKALAEGNQLALAVSTATKAEKYLDQVVVSTSGLVDSGKDVTGLLEKVSRAQLKHLELLRLIAAEASEEARGVVEQALQMTQLGRESILELRGEEADDKIKNGVEENREREMGEEELEATAASESSEAVPAEIRGSL